MCHGKLLFYNVEWLHGASTQHVENDNGHSQQPSFHSFSNMMFQNKNKPKAAFKLYSYYQSTDDSLLHGCVKSSNFKEAVGISIVATELVETKDERETDNHSKCSCFFLILNCNIYTDPRYRSNIHVDALLNTVFARKAHQGNFKRAFITLVDMLVCSFSYLAVTPDRSGFRTRRKTRSLCRLGLVRRCVENVNPFRWVFVRGPRLLLSLSLSLSL